MGCPSPFFGCVGCVGCVRPATNQRGAFIDFGVLVWCNAIRAPPLEEYNKKEFIKKIGNRYDQTEIETEMLPPLHRSPFSAIFLQEHDMENSLK